MHQQESTRQLYVYVAGPYSRGDVAVNVRNAITAANQVVDLNAIPYLPHLTHFWHLVTPRAYEWWLWYDRQWLAKCDAMLRLPGESSGSDQEERYAALLGIPVARSIEELRTILETL